MSILKPAVQRDGRFENSVPTSVGDPSTMLRVLRKLIGNRAETIPRRPLGPFRTDVAVYRQPSVTGIRITWLGHSSMLLEMGRTTILIDPVWSQRASMVQWAGPKRFFAPPLAIADLPPLDAVLLSHDHYDRSEEHTSELQSRQYLVCRLLLE